MHEGGRRARRRYRLLDVLSGTHMLHRPRRRPRSSPAPAHVNRAVRRGAACLLPLVSLPCLALLLLQSGSPVDQGVGFSPRHLLSTDPRGGHAHNDSSPGGGGEPKLVWEECSLETESSFTAGWIALWAVLIFWLFVALAIICDDFFVPSLEEISDRLNLTEDVAGATFMAAGSSAPELFTSLAGVFVKSDVGVGTIVGSAIFNLLIIIALSAALAGKVLHIDWRPLTRDAVFYSLSIICFIVFAWDGRITFPEAAGLFCLYICYVCLMFLNPHLMRLLNSVNCCCAKVQADSEAAQPDDPTAGKEAAAAEDKKFHHNPQINPLAHPPAPRRPSASASQTSNQVDAKADEAASEEEDAAIVILSCMPAVPMAVPCRVGEGGVSWVRLAGAWILFLFAFPWAWAFAWTIPNCSKPHLKKWYVASFTLSVTWIALCSFTMVLLVGRTGCTLNMQPFVMGLVVVAVGTSVPDALSSVIVARDGYGDMAVSNAIGSNVFDIDLGLGLPFMIRMLIDQFEPIQLLSHTEQELRLKHPGNPFIPHVKFGFILFFVLVLCFLVFVAVRFRLNKFVGVSFVAMYAAFILYAVVQEFACDKGFGC